MKSKIQILEEKHRKLTDHIVLLNNRVAEQFDMLKKQDGRIEELVNDKEKLHKIIEKQEKKIIKLIGKKVKAINWAELRSNQVAQLINSIENQSKINLHTQTSLDLNPIVKNVMNLITKK